MSIRRVLGIPEKPHHSSAETDTVRKIVDALDQLDQNQARFIAAFGYILGRVANADMHISAEETREMERIIKEYGHLPEDQALIIVQMAKTHNQLFGATENFLVTREFNHIATRDEKLALLHCLYAVSAVDEGVSSVEDNEIRQIASELLIEHPDFISVRSAWKNQITLFQNLPGPDTGSSN